jgi:glycosyltransferase involved in cell wall biosynthesis
MSSKSSTPAVLVANLSAPEINHLGAELERRGVLRHYVRPYVNKQRWWERTLERSPGIGRTLRRRSPPGDLPLARLAGAGIAPDLAAALAVRLPFTSLAWRRRISHKLVFAAERAVARMAGSLATDIDIVVCSYGTAQYAFEAVHRRGGRAVLNYPIAHNRYQAALYREEARLAPEFAAALPRLEDLPQEYSRRLDVECELADFILLGSSFARDSFIRVGYDARKLVVISYGVDTQRFYPRTELRREGVFRVLFVGQIGQRKGVSYLLQAYKQFRKPDTELHLVGGYVSGREVYASYADLYQHTENVPQQELPALYHRADVLVLPTLIEGMPLVVLEAMACGIPVVVTPNGPGDLVRDGVEGFVVPIRDPEAIALRLEQLYQDPKLREQMGREARQQALRFSWDIYSRRAADAVLGPQIPNVDASQVAPATAMPIARSS